MKLLLDTHVLLWLQTEQERLGASLALLEDEANELFVSAVTTWELAIKVGLGKMAVPAAVLDFVETRAARIGATLMPISHAHAAGVVRLPEVHRDPFDRLLVSQAIAEGATLLTADAVLRGYGPIVQLVGDSGTAT